MVMRGCVPSTQWLHHEVATGQTYHLSLASDVMSREATRACLLQICLCDVEHIENLHLREDRVLALLIS